MKKVLIIADDVTGGDDIGVMYRKSGHPTALYPYSQSSQATFGPYSKLVVDTDSRFVPAQEAYRRVRETAERFSGCGVSLYFSKQCSVFRGNIGAEFDATLDAAGVGFAPVVLGFPDNGRTTLHQIHYVYGVRLEDSQFRSDPVNPMTESDLVAILSAQTTRPVSAVHYEEYEQGEAHLRAVLEQKRARGGYAIFDVRHNEDLALLARVLRDERVICGSSAIAYYLGLEEPPEAPAQSFAPVHSGHAGEVLCLAGSLTPQTAQQLAWLQEQGWPLLTLQTLELFDPAKKAAELARLRAAFLNLHGRAPITTIHTSNEPETVRETKLLAAREGYSEAEASVLISDTLAQLGRALAQECGLRRMIVCGGDTSAAFCRVFGIAGMEIGEEIESGVPVCSGIQNPALRFVLKSGSFGSPEFLGKALAKLLDGEEPV